MSTLGKMTRRAFLFGSVAVAGGVAFGYYKYKQPYPNPLSDDVADTEDGIADDAVALTPYLLIDQQGITIITPRAEMGQGIHTTLAALVAEELDVAWDDIRTIHGPTSNAYYNGALMEGGVPFPSYDQSTMAETMRGAMGVVGKFLGMQITGGSTSSMDAYTKMREAGAAARLVLMAAAAQKWGVAAAKLKTADGFVINPKNDEKLSYIELAKTAASIEVPTEVTLKDKSEWRYLGKTMPKKDMPAKCTGTATFGIDVERPDMVYATVVMNPRLGGGMKSFDDAAAKTMRGVQQIIPLEGGVAVVADNTWRAFKAAKAITFEWDDAPYPPTTEAMFEKMAGAFSLEPDATHHDEGDVEAALAESANTIEVEYRAPFLAHSTMEPMNATALLTDDALHIWTGTQGPTSLRDAAAKATGLETSQVHVHVELLGGGFGRRGEIDFGMQAVAIAKTMKGTPVKMTWTREEDTQHDVYRPGAIGRFRGIMGDNGVPETLQIKVSSPSATRSALGRLGVPPTGSDKMIVEGSSEQPYSIRNHQVIGYAPDIPVPLGFWRSVGASYNGFFHECFLDEMAVMGKVDPLQMRLDMTKDFRVANQVLKAIGELSGWAKPMPKGKARGLAMTLSFGSYTAQVIEVSETTKGIKIDKIYCVVDPGIALDPGNIEAQIQSGVIYGLSAAVMGEITFDDGKVQQSNFNDYGALKMAQVPDIEVKILENGPVLKGIGEPGTPPSKPALANAVFALTGKRIREYPLNKHVKFA